MMKVVQLLKEYYSTSINDNISAMTMRQFTALFTGGCAALFFFAGSMWLLIFGGYFPDNERLVFVSIALGPLAMAAAMAGYGVWWFTMFVLALFLGNRDHPSAVDHENDG